MNIPVSCLLILVAGLSVAMTQPAEAQPARNARPEIVAIYFPGYHQDDHYDSWFGEGWNEWKLLAQAPARFPNQRLFRPAWGDFDEADPVWMARQISLAADHGVDVFLFDWYWSSGVKILERPLEHAFLQATNQSRLKYALMWANHDWRNYFPAPRDGEAPLLLPSRTSPRDFGRLIDYCVTNYFARNNYWRVQRALYFGIFDSESFMKQLGGPGEARRVLENAREHTRRGGMGAIHFAAFHGDPGAVPRLRDAGFDSVTSYNIVASSKASLPDHPLDLYGDLVDHHAVVWKGMDTGMLPYFPVLTVGWDCTPRWALDTPFPPKNGGYPYGTVVVSNTPAEFGRLCKLAREHVRSAKLPPPAILVNAWNEWTEGSVLLPEKEHGTAFLQKLKDF